MFLRHLIPLPLIDIQVKFYGDRPRGTPPSGEVKHKGGSMERLEDSANVVIELLKTKCMPILLYGLDACPRLVLVSLDHWTVLLCRVVEKFSM